MSYAYFQIHYYHREHLFHIRFNNENRTQLILYADKATERISSNPSVHHSLFNTSQLPSTLVLFLHITPTLISCYVNCELTDQEFIVDSNYLQNILRQTMNYKEQQQQQPVEYNRQSTLVLFNRSIEQIAANFFCSKLDKKNDELLPDKYALK
jgi:hypothetical protein